MAITSVWDLLTWFWWPSSDPEICKTCGAKLEPLGRYGEGGGAILDCPRERFHPGTESMVPS